MEYFLEMFDKYGYPIITVFALATWIVWQTRDSKKERKEWYEEATKERKEWFENSKEERTEWLDTQKEMSTSHNIALDKVIDALHDMKLFISEQIKK